MFRVLLLGSPFPFNTFRQQRLYFVGLRMFLNLKEKGEFSYLGFLSLIVILSHLSFVKWTMADLPSTFRMICWPEYSPAHNINYSINIWEKRWKRSLLEILPSAVLISFFLYLPCETPESIRTDQIELSANTDKVIYDSLGKTYGWIRGRSQ